MKVTCWCVGFWMSRRVNEMPQSAHLLDHSDAAFAIRSVILSAYAPVLNEARSMAYVSFLDADDFQ
jgi:hypothetical protein